MSEPPDNPPVPRTAFSKTAIVLAVFGVLTIGGYGWAAITDFEPGSPAREEIPSSVRSSPGGYRTYHFWPSGYHGGK